MIGLKDSYGLYARAYPVYITIAPIVLVLFPLLPEGYDWKLGGASAIVLLPLSYLCKQIGGVFGKKLEKRLWTQWGGPPTTRFLRHHNSESNASTRDRAHAKFRRLGLHVPSREEEKRDPQGTDVFYESCIDELRARTRDSKRYPRVFEELKNYGFWRNIFALRYCGLVFTGVSFSICLITGVDGWSIGKPSGSALVPALINIGLILFWRFWCTENTVRIAADRYAKFLLEACLDLEEEDGNSSFSER